MTTARSITNQFAALAELRAKATPGPWRDAGHGEITGPAIFAGQTRITIAVDARDNDADFIAAAGSLNLPALLAYARALEAVADAARAERNPLVQHIVHDQCVVGDVDRALRALDALGVNQLPSGSPR